MLCIRRHSQVGIDLTEMDLRAVKIIQKDRRWQLLASTIVPLDSQIPARLALFKALQKVREQLAYRHEKTVIAVDHDAVIHKTLRLEPTLHESEVYRYLQKQSPVLFHAPSQELYYDYACLTQATASSNQWHVWVAKQSTIHELVQIMKASHYRLRAVDISDLAVVRALHYCGIDTTQEDHCFGILFPKRHQLKIILFSHQRWHDSLTIDHLHSLDAALKYYYQTHALKKLHCIYYPPEIEKMFEKEVEIPIIPLKIPAFDHRLLTSLGLALWGSHAFT